MYANLAVKIGDFETIYACEVQVTPDGWLRIVEDENNGESSYAEPGEEHKTRVIALPAGGLTVTADF